jgi:hypothetical protein
MENKITLARYGNGIAICIRGTTDFIERESNRLLNHGAAGTGELQEVSNTFGYIVSSLERMKAALANDFFVKWLMNGTSKQYKGNPDGLKLATECAAERVISELDWEGGFSIYGGSATSHAIAQNGRAETWEE